MKKINWSLWLVITILLMALFAGVYIFNVMHNYPRVVSVYQYRYGQMATAEYKQKLINYTKFELGDSIEGLNWKELLEWEHKYLIYDLALPYRAELPIDILNLGEGRCGEFSLLYTGLLLANDYECRLIIDCSVMEDEDSKAGDHVFVQIWLNSSWLHVDPTSNIINNPYIYATNWGKDINCIYAITDKEVVDITKDFIPPEDL